MGLTLGRRALLSGAAIALFLPPVIFAAFPQWQPALFGASVLGVPLGVVLAVVLIAAIMALTTIAAREARGETGGEGEQ